MPEPVTLAVWLGTCPALVDAALVQALGVESETSAHAPGEATPMALLEARAESALSEPKEAKLSSLITAPRSLARCRRCRRK